MFNAVRACGVLCPRARGGGGGEIGGEGSEAFYVIGKATLSSVPTSPTSLCRVAFVTEKCVLFQKLHRYNSIKTIDISLLSSSLF